MIGILNDVFIIFNESVLLMNNSRKENNSNCSNKLFPYFSVESSLNKSNDDLSTAFPPSTKNQFRTRIKIQKEICHKVDPFIHLPGIFIGANLHLSLLYSHSFCATIRSESFQSRYQSGSGWRVCLHFQHGQGNKNQIKYEPVRR